MLALGLRNLVTTSTTLTGSGWNAALPLNNMRTRDLSQVARSTSNSASFVVDHGTAKTARVMVMMATNLSSQATIQWNRGSTSGNNNIYVGSALNAWAFAPTTYNGRQYATRMTIIASSSARYDEIVISDPGTSYIEIGRLWISDLWQPQFGAVHPLSDIVQDLSAIDRSDGGNLWINRKRRLRSVQFALQGLTTAEGATLHDLMVTSGITEEVLYVPDVADAEANQRYGFISTMQQLDALEYPFPRRRALPMRLTEIA